eukprot:m.60100 g.60100  ORF g.60100 m.60100 type:complete len:451 (+) comp7004_c0_seq2:426-1778(+)
MCSMDMSGHHEPVTVDRPALYPTEFLQRRYGVCTTVHPDCELSSFKAGVERLIALGRAVLPIGYDSVEAYVSQTIGLPEAAEVPHVTILRVDVLDVQHCSPITGIANRAMNMLMSGLLPASVQGVFVDGPGRHGDRVVFAVLPDAQHEEIRDALMQRFDLEIDEILLLPFGKCVEHCGFFYETTDGIATSELSFISETGYAATVTHSNLTSGMLRASHPVSVESNFGAHNFANIVGTRIDTHTDLTVARLCMDTASAWQALKLTIAAIPAYLCSKAEFDADVWGKAHLANVFQKAVELSPASYDSGPDSKFGAYTSGHDFSAPTLPHQATPPRPPGPRSLVLCGAVLRPCIHHRGQDTECARDCRGRYLSNSIVLYDFSALPSRRGGLSGAPLFLEKRRDDGRHTMLGVYYGGAAGSPDYAIFIPAWTIANYLETFPCGVLNGDRLLLPP